MWSSNLSGKFCGHYPLRGSGPPHFKSQGHLNDIFYSAKLSTDESITTKGCVLNQISSTGWTSVLSTGWTSVLCTYIYNVKLIGWDGVEYSCGQRFKQSKTPTIRWTKQSQPASASEYLQRTGGIHLRGVGSRSCPKHTLFN